MRSVVSVAANVGIFTGYVFVALFVMPHVRLESIVTRVSGVLFFFTCGLTHLHNAAHSLTTAAYNPLLTWHALGNHLVQVAAVAVFVRGLYYEVRREGVWPARLGKG